MATILFYLAAFLWALTSYLGENVSNVAIAGMFMAIGGLWAGDMSEIQSFFAIPIGILAIVVMAATIIKHRKK